MKVFSDRQLNPHFRVVVDGLPPQVRFPAGGRENFYFRPLPSSHLSREGSRGLWSSFLRFVSLPPSFFFFLPRLALLANNTPTLESGKSRSSIPPIESIPLRLLVLARALISSLFLLGPPSPFASHGIRGTTKLWSQVELFL